MIGDWGADEFELARVEFDPLLSQHLAEKQAADKVPDGESIRLGNFINVIGGNKASRSGHVFDDHRRLAGNMLAHMAREGASVSIESAAGGKADDDPDGFPFVKIIRRRACAKEGNQAQSENQQS